MIEIPCIIVCKRKGDWNHPFNRRTTLLSTFGAVLFSFKLGIVVTDLRSKEILHFILVPEFRPYFYSSIVIYCFISMFCNLPALSRSDLL